MKKETESYFAELAVPDGAVTSPMTDALYAATTALHTLIAEQTAWVHKVEGLRRAADAVEEDATAYAPFLRFKTTVTALQKELQKAAEALDRAADVRFQLDRYAIDARKAREKRENAPT